jgi:hypothetical protein
MQRHVKYSGSGTSSSGVEAACLLSAASMSPVQLHAPSRGLWSSSQSLLWVASVEQHKKRTFSARSFECVGPQLWNRLPQDLRLWGIQITEPARFHCLTSRPRRISKSLRFTTGSQRVEQTQGGYCWPRAALRNQHWFQWTWPQLVARMSFYALSSTRNSPYSSCYLRLEMSVTARIRSTGLQKIE